MVQLKLPVSSKRTLLLLNLTLVVTYNNKLTHPPLCITNEIGDEGAKAIGKAMKNNKTLKVLDLSGIISYC